MELTRQATQEVTVLVLSATELGADGKLRSSDFTVTSYLRKVGLDFFEIRGKKTHTYTHIHTHTHTYTHNACPAVHFYWPPLTFYQITCDPLCNLAVVV